MSETLDDFLDTPRFEVGDADDIDADGMPASHLLFSDGAVIAEFIDASDTEHACRCMESLRRLSPATRRLLIERPEAVEKAVKAVEAEVECVNENNSEMRMRKRSIARCRILDAVHAMTGVKP